MSMRAALVALVGIVAIVATACGLPCGLGGRCDIVADEGEGEGDSGIVCGSNDTQHHIDGTCDFEMSSCSDDSLYRIHCATPTTCECQESTSAGQLITSTFEITASCQDFSTLDDLDRFVAFANENCSWSLSAQ